MKLRLLLLPFSILISLPFHSYSMDRDKELLRLISGKIILDLIQKKQEEYTKNNNTTPEFKEYIASAQMNFETLTKNTHPDVLNQFDQLKTVLTTEELDYNIKKFIDYFYKKSAE